MLEEIQVWGWLLYGALVLVILSIDLLAHRSKEGESHRAALRWITVWIAAGLGFSLVIWVLFGLDGTQEYIAAYLIEESLSLDNVFVFLLIFQTLRIPPRNQHRVLFWGVFGAGVLRAAFVFTGIALLNTWWWISFVLGAVLLYSANIAFRGDLSRKEKIKVVDWLSRRLPIAQEPAASQFVIRRGGRLLITPMLIALIAIEVSDLAFAIDSIPAALSVSLHPFIIYTSNVFAILGLRALYIVLAQGISKLKYLHFGLAGVLAFAGLKLTLRKWIHIPPLPSVVVILLIIGAVVLVSLRERSEDKVTH